MTLLSDAAHTLLAQRTQEPAAAHTRTLIVPAAYGILHLHPNSLMTLLSDAAHTSH
jgi:hypothetical protein